MDNVARFNRQQPPEPRMREISTDYQKMQQMFFAKQLSLVEIMDILAALEQEVRQLGSAA